VKNKNKNISETTILSQQQQQLIGMYQTTFKYAGHDKFGNTSVIVIGFFFATIK